MSFILNYFLFFLRRLQNNSKIFIDNLKSQNQKQLRFDYESNNKKRYYNMHVFFLNINKIERFITYLNNEQQKKWVDCIILSTFRIIVNNNIIQRYFLNYRNVIIKIHAMNEIHIYDFEHSIKFVYFVFVEYLKRFWN